MSTVKHLEGQLAATKKLVAFRQSIHKLTNNREFREVILENFCKEECARYAQESGDPALTPAQRADALAMSQAAGHIRRWLSIQIQMANSAEDNIVNLEDAIQEARVEEARVGTDEEGVE